MHPVCALQVTDVKENYGRRLTECSSMVMLRVTFKTHLHIYVSSLDRGEKYSRVTLRGSPPSYFFPWRGCSVAPLLGESPRGMAVECSTCYSSLGRIVTVSTSVL